MGNYQNLSDALQKRIQQDWAEGARFPFACPNEAVIRRDMSHDRQNLWRPAFVRDAEKIMHSAYYNRYTDKTQVFSCYRNDDLTRRALHVQLVSRIARNIGRMLGLNLDLIEAIALGHDIGHTPFGHAGERFLSQLYHDQTGRSFNHNVHSVRVLDGIFRYNISLQTLDGILCHNGEFEQQEYRPMPLSDFAAFDEKVEACYTDEAAIGRLVPNTLEGCVVRVSDIIAYVGKDRQDAYKTGLFTHDPFADTATIGKNNAEIINNLTVNIVENSYGKDHLCMEPTYFAELKKCKKENYEYIYNSPAVATLYDEVIGPMFAQLYERLLWDVVHKKRDSAVYRHHIDFVNDRRRLCLDKSDYAAQEPNQIVVDYLASMTDDYFLDLYAFLFPDSTLHVDYVSYFEDLAKPPADCERT